MIINISGIFDPLITNQLSGRLPNILAKTNPNLSLLCYDWYVACGSPGLGTQAYCMSARRSVWVCDVYVILGQLGNGHVWNLKMLLIYVKLWWLAVFMQMKHRLVSGTGQFMAVVKHVYDLAMQIASSHEIIFGSTKLVGFFGPNTDTWCVFLICKKNTFQSQTVRKWKYFSEKFATSASFFSTL